VRSHINYSLLSSTTYITYCIDALNLSAASVKVLGVCVGMIVLEEYLAINDTNLLRSAIFLWSLPFDLLCNLQRWIVLNGAKLLCNELSILFDSDIHVVHELYVKTGDLFVSLFVWGLMALSAQIGYITP